MTKPKTLSEIVRAKTNKVHRHICDLANGSKEWTMCIPVQPDDSDVLLNSACDLADKLAQALEKAEGALIAADMGFDRLRPAFSSHPGFQEQGVVVEALEEIQKLKTELEAK